MRALFFTTLAILLAFAALATADHCTTWTTSAPEITFDPYYVDNDLGQPGFSYVNVYEETNGIGGLQRQDDVVDETCHDLILPDRLIEQIAYGG